MDCGLRIFGPMAHTKDSARARYSANRKPATVGSTTSEPPSSSATGIMAWATSAGTAPPAQARANPRPPRQGLRKDRRKCLTAADERFSGRCRNHAGEQYGRPKTENRHG